MSEDVGFALWGFGAWGRCHAAAIAKTPGARLSVIISRSDENRRQARELFPNVPIVDDPDAALSRADVEVVDIVLPTDLHRDAALRAFDHRRHVLLEKPMAPSIADCQAIIARANASGRLLAIGHELRLSSLWGEVKRVIDAGVIGAPRYVLVELSRRPYRAGHGGWRYDRSRVGSWILEEPIHFFDLARWYFSPTEEPDRVSATSSGEPSRPGLDDNFAAMLSFTGGSFAVVAQTLAAFEHHQTVKVTGSKGALWAAWSGVMDRTRDATHSLRVFDGETLSDRPIATPSGELYELEAEIRAMALAARGLGQVGATSEDGLWSVAMCLAAEQAIRTTSHVRVRELLVGAC